MIDKDVEDLSDYKGSKAYSYFKQCWLSNISYHRLGSSKYCLLKSDCFPSERLIDSPHTLWLRLPKKEGKVTTAHCTCMAGMSSICNHVAAALFRVEAAMRLGLTNPARTTKDCEWLPNRKYVQPVKISTEMTTLRGKKRKKMLSTPKPNYNPIIKNNQKTSTFLGIATAFEKVTPESVLSITLLKPKIDFVEEVVS